MVNNLPTETTQNVTENDDKINKLLPLHNETSVENLQRGRIQKYLHRDIVII